jgi:hypothetical protein
MIRPKMARRIYLLLAGVALALTVALNACADDAVAPGEGGGSGIAGVVLAGPQCPVISTRSPCPDLPLAVTLRIEEAGGGDVRTIESNAAGQFRVDLPPGEYVLVAQPVGDGPFPAPPGEQAVVVRAGSITEVPVFYDTGIR